MGQWEREHRIGQRLSADAGDPFIIAMAVREMAFCERNYDYWFLLMLGSHLLAAVSEWESMVRRQCAEDNDLLSAIDDLHYSSDLLPRKMQLWKDLTQATRLFRGDEPLFNDVRVEINFEARAQGVMEMHEHAFQASMVIPEVEWTQEMLKQAYSYWVSYLIQPDIWLECEKRIGVPFVLELSEIHDWMPRAMVLGGMPFELRFDKLLVPMTAVKKRPYNVRLFNYLASMYEHISDIGYKEGVFRLMMDQIKEVRAGNGWLDVGCGTGLLGKYAPFDVKLSGVDISPKMSDLARTRLREDGSAIYVEVLKRDAVETGYEADVFDAALMSFVEIWMTENHFYRVMAELHRVVKPGGSVVVNFHKPPLQWKVSVSDTLLHRLYYSRVDFVENKIVGSDGQLRDVHLLVVKV